MPATRQHRKAKLPRRFEDLVRLMPPQAIGDDAQYENAVEMIDRLMTGGKLTRGQAIYLETLVQLVQAYEAEHDPVDVSGLSGLDSLKHLLKQNQMHASDLADLLGVHASMGSKILRGERPLTLSHVKKLAEAFRVRPDLFID